LLLNLLGNCAPLPLRDTLARRDCQQDRTWTPSSIDIQLTNLDDIYTVLGWIGLLTLVLGTLLQMAALPRRW